MGIVFKMIASVPVKTLRPLCLPAGNNTALGFPSLVMVTCVSARNQLQQSGELGFGRAHRNGQAHARQDDRLLQDLQSCRLVFREFGIQLVSSSWHQCSHM